VTISTKSRKSNARRSPVFDAQVKPSRWRGIDGVDLSRPLSGQQLEAPRATLSENLVSFFRDQNLTPYQP
jgi:hypothetical protein